MGNTAEGAALHSSILWGGLSVHSKHRPSYVLNGTPYTLTTAEDVTVYPDLPVPIGFVLVSVKKKKIEASFQAWEVLQYSVPGKIGLVIQVEMGGGQMGEVDVVLDTKFAL